ncbi:MAG TPA: hypothetical protein VJ891_00945, partial [Casimicrobiaceae bacterium]|nr:hypothetical protein [Casimicrobiaceae bacterium]
MRWPPPVRVSLAPSIAAFVLIASLAFATCVVLGTLPLDRLVIALAMIAVVGWAIDRIFVVALRCGGRAVRGLELRGDLTIIVLNADGTACAGRV